MITWRPASFRFLSTIALPGCAGDVPLNLRPKKYPPSTLSHIPRTFFSAVNIFNRSVALVNRSMPSTAGATIGVPPARVVHDVSHWSLSAGRLSLVLAHRQVICLREALPHVRCKRLVTGVEHAHPVHWAIHRVRHDLIQGGEVVATRVLAADCRAVSLGRQ